MTSYKPEQTEQTDDLSEQIRDVTKKVHKKANNTELMQAFQRGNISLMQYKLLLCSLYMIYEALEEELDRNASHETVAPIYFPQELARMPVLKKDLEHFYGQNWRKKMIIPAATLRYTKRLREIGRSYPEYLVAHAYTRYLGDLSGGQILSRVPQKCLGLKNGDGLAFFLFPAISSPNLFKQLYRSRMNSIELTETQNKKVLEEAVRAFEFNIQVFDEIQDMLTPSERNENIRPTKAHLKTHIIKACESSVLPFLSFGSTILRMLVGVCLASVVGIVISAL